MVIEFLFTMKATRFLLSKNPSCWPYYALWKNHLQMNPEDSVVEPVHKESSQDETTESLFCGPHFSMEDVSNSLPKVEEVHAIVKSRQMVFQ